VARVWAALDDPSSWEAISGVDRVMSPSIDDEGHLQGFAFESVAAGKKYVGQARPAGREPQKMMAWDIETSEMRGRVMVSLAPLEGDTRVHVTLRVESVGMLSAVFFPVIASAVGEGFPETVEDFARTLAG
jgi:carbon monoxide dehydrogenase subunit G